MAITITAEERNALYDRVLDRLSGIEDILLAAGSEDFATADRLSREYADELMLICDGLGWGTRSESDVVELSTPPRAITARVRPAAGRRGFRAGGASEELGRKPIARGEEPPGGSGVHECAPDPGPHFVTGRAHRPRRPRRRDCPTTPRPPGAPDGWVTLPRPSEEANLAVVTGTIMEEPIRDRSRAGHPVTVLLIAFKAPDEEAHPYTACLEVEALDSVVDSQRSLLRVGRRLVVLGRLTGAGGLWAGVVLAEDAQQPSGQGSGRP